MTLADIESDDPARQLHGFGSVNTNHFPAELRPRIEAAIRKGLDSPDAKVRRNAAVSAGGQKVDGTAARIVACVATDAQGRGEYVRALGRLADPVGLDVILTPPDAANGAIADIDAEALANFNGNDRAFAALKSAATGADRIVRGRAMHALARGVDPRGVNLLITAAEDPDQLVRWAAIQSLAERKDPRGLDTAIKAMSDSSDKIRLSAVFAVGASGQSDPKRAADTLFPLSQTAAEPIRFAATMVLVALKDERVLPRLQTMAAGSMTEPIPGMLFEEVPASAGIRGLARLGTPAALSALMAFRTDPQRRQWVTSALSEQHSPTIARDAWKMYLAAPPATRPTTEPTTRPTTQPATRLGLQPYQPSEREQLLNLTVGSADATLRDEIADTIPTTRPTQRPELRRAVRNISKRLATATSQPTH